MTYANGIPEGYKATELGVLPEEWETVNFSDCFIHKKGKIPSHINTSNFQLTGKYPIVDQSTNYIAGYTDDETKLFKEPLPVIIFGDHTRIFKFVDFPFAIGAQGTKIFIPNRELFDPQFLFYTLSNLEIPNRGYNRHSKLLNDYSIVKPPLPEQHAIATTLRTVQEAKEKTDAVIAATKVLKAAMMKHLFTKNTSKSFNYGEWKECRLGDVINLKRGYDLPNADRVFGPYPVISSSGVFSYHKEPKAKGPGVITGRYGTLGEVFYVEGDYWPLNTTLYVQDFKGNNPRYISYLLQTIKLGEQNFASSVPGVNRNILHQLIVQIPSIPAQEKIADIIHVIDQKIAAEQSRKEALDTLFTSLLHDLMTAKIRVGYEGTPATKTSV